MGNKDKSIEAQVIFKAIDIINGNACHFITFEELSSQERVYLQVGIGNYMMIVEGDRGLLHYKEQKKRYKSKFQSFEREIHRMIQGPTPTLIEENKEAEMIALDEEVIAVLEEKEAFIEEENNAV